MNHASGAVAPPDAEVVQGPAGGLPIGDGMRR